MRSLKRKVAPGILIGERELTLTLHPARSLLADGALAELEQLLREILPHWSSKLRVGVEHGVRAAINASRPGALPAAVRKQIRPGSHYKALARALGPGAYERNTGFTMLGGASAGVSVSLDLDEWLFGPKPDGQSWGNAVNVDVTVGPGWNGTKSVTNRTSGPGACPTCTPCEVTKTVNNATLTGTGTATSG